MEKIKNLLKRLCEIPSVCGREGMGKAMLFDLAGQYFDNMYSDSFGNLVLVKKSSKQNAPRLQIDAHFDEVGMMVCEICDGGFLGVRAIGGLDMRVLCATEVTIYGKEKIYGVVTSVPPHISGGKGDVPKIQDIYIDTGLDKETLEGLVRAGDIVEFKDGMCELLNNRVVSKSLDDKACACAVIDMASRADRDKLEYDLYITISAQEESGKNGAKLIAYDIQPDIAVVTDVNFAVGEEIDETESIAVGEGAGIDISALTDVKLTRSIMKMLDSKGIKYQRVCEPSRTSTNSDGVSVAGKGVRTVLMSIPLKSMHTPSELVCLDDIKSMSDILLEIAYTKKEAL
ncbi:MAG: hypothetical protein E7622_03450 [Ruminococcaceae bacterium]|nr:hypothetical protein [Oscillospiraceae bacterium]